MGVEEGAIYSAVSPCWQSRALLDMEPDALKRIKANLIHAAMAIELEIADREKRAEKLHRLAMARQGHASARKPA